MLHRKFPERRLSMYHLLKVYKQHGIKKKKIRKTKIITEQHRQRIHEECLVAKRQLAEHKAQGYRIIYCDELCTTVSTIPSHAYSLKKQPLKIDLRQFSQRCVATITSFSAEAGMELVMNFDRSVDKPKFISWLKALRQRHPFRRLCLFLDRLSVHRSRDVAEVLRQLQIAAIFNGSYSVSATGSIIDLLFLHFSRTTTP